MIKGSSTIDNIRAEISLVGDLVQVVPDDVLVVNSDFDYVQVCKQLSVEVESLPLLKIWVKSRNHYVWLQEFTAQIDCPSKFVEKTARTVLADNWNVTLPDWLSDGDVIEQDLLEIPVDNSNHSNFMDRILDHFLGRVLSDDVLNTGNIPAIVLSLVSEEANSAFAEYPILKRCLEAKTEEWKHSSPGTWVSGVCDQLIQEPSLVWKWLSAWALLNRYPEKLWEYVLTPKRILLLKGIPGDALGELPLEADAREQAEEQIQFFFEEIRQKIDSSESFIALLERTSGRLNTEFKYLSGILANQQFDVTEKEVNATQERFKSCPGVSPGMLAEMRLSIKPGRPRALSPSDDLSAQTWIEWITNEYLPYRSWQIQSNHYDNEVENTVTGFSDWYIEQYTSIHKDDSLSLVHSLNDLGSSLDDNELVVVLVIDCLPLWFMKLLDDALKNVGLNRNVQEYRFAPLPTTTEYSKPLLLSGIWSGYEKDYSKILESRSKSSWSNRKSIYLANLKALAEMELPAEPAVAFLNFMEFDELLHSDVLEKNSTYEIEFHRIAVRLSETLRRIAEALAAMKKGLQVHVVTDHGACRILEEEKKSFDAAVVASLFPDEKHRYAVVKEDDADSIPDHLWSIGYRFKRPFVSEKILFFLPRGHNTVKHPKKGSYFVHGGVTPEEVLVPAAVYRTEKAEWKSPGVRFLNLDINKETGLAQFFVQRLVPLELEIQNPNNIGIKIKQFGVLSPATDLKDFETPEIDPEKTGVAHVDCYFEKSALEENSLVIEVSYEISGETRVVTEEIESEFKSALRTGVNLRDL